MGSLFCFCFFVSALPSRPTPNWPNQALKHGAGGTARARRTQGMARTECRRRQGTTAEPKRNDRAGLILQQGHVAGPLILVVFLCATQATCALPSRGPNRGSPRNSLSQSQTTHAERQCLHHRRYALRQPPKLSTWADRQKGKDGRPPKCET